MTRLLSLLASIALLGTACTPGSALDDIDPLDGFQGQPVDDKGFYLATAVWDSPVINVCFESPTAADAPWQDLTRQRVQETWEAHTPLRFVGWGTCASGDPGIHVQFADAGARVLDFGQNISGLTNGLRLNYAYQSWVNSCDDDAMTSNGYTVRQNCFRNNTVHEFGHAISLYHEQDRHDSTCTDTTGSQGGTEVGPYDAGSVMNYCNGARWANGGVLSDGDIETAITLYGHRTPSADFNDDGYADLVVGAPGVAAGGDTESGRVYLYYGDPAGHSGYDTRIDRDTSGVEGVTEAYDRFGQATAFGDFNGDGYDDLIVGAPGDTVNGQGSAGAINVLYGSASGVSTSGGALITEDDTSGASEAGDDFGAALAVGDFDRDGYDDLAVGVPGQDVGSKAGAGALRVFYGSATGLSAADEDAWNQDSSGVVSTASAGGAFGSALAVGDFDKDGYDDLAVSAPYDDVGGTPEAGLVVVFPGSSGGITASGDSRWHQDISGVQDVVEQGDHYGAALTAGDFDNDGYDDLAIGIPDEVIGGIASGKINVLFGSDAGLSSAGNQDWHQDSVGVNGSNENGDRYGAALRAGDFDRDGFMDLAIGVPGDEINGKGGAGWVNVLFGSGAGLSSAPDQGWHQDTSGVMDVAEAGDAFGSALAVGDWDGDFAVDLAIGVPGENSGGGFMVLYAQPSSGLTATGDELYTHNSSGAEFGTSVR
ncbi:MAG: FG-GAP repeat protein [Alphaproteobacteria bacterium]|nr:FG-GAP repeat protein [Alphaproteobacteria bacterium]